MLLLSLHQLYIIPITEKLLNTFFGTKKYFKLSSPAGFEPWSDEHSINNSPKIALKVLDRIVSER